MSRGTHLLALDQGTSSSRALIFNRNGEVVALAQEEVSTQYPQPGWVEQDAQALWATQLATARRALRDSGLSARDIAAIGITNQRETTVLWNRRTGQPLHPALVWQDRRTEPLCAVLREQGWAEAIAQRTGLVPDPYFSGTKLRWLLDHLPGAQAAAEAGELAFGTIDCWLLWQLSGGAVHATDTTNASRTLLWNLQEQRWDEALLKALNIPPAVLPQVLPSAGDFGHAHATWLGEAIPITGVAGDQQAALFGQACFQAGLAKNTYGTGCFMLVHTGSQRWHSRHGLLATAVATSPANPPAYALEGSVFIGGAVVQWLRDGLGAIQSSGQISDLAQSVPDSGGVIMVPAFVGLGSPYWDAQARGAILGLTRGSTMAHIARAALESIAFQSAALLEAVNGDAQAAGATPVAELRVDGGASTNDLLMQFQADLLGIPVVRPSVTETTARGAAWLAGLGASVYAGTDELAGLWRAERCFEPQGDREAARARMAQWERAVRQVRQG